jgi:hypothetical protein
MSKLGKRAILILILAVLTFSIIPVLPVHAVTITDVLNDDDLPLDPTDRDKGSEVHVFGEDVTAGVDVNLYWDAVKAWDDGEGLLNSTEAESDGSFEVWFNVPEALNGDHYLWVKDTETGDTTKWGPFVVEAKLSLDPDSGLEGDKKISLKGYGFSDEVDIVTVNFTGADLTTSPGTPETNDLGSWSATFTVPDVGGVYGDYEVYAEDEEGVFATTDFTVGASIELSVDEGPVGTVVEIEGRGFTGDNVTEITCGGVICGVVDEDDLEIDDGEFKLDIVIPSVADVDEYDIEVTDGINTADESFDVQGLAEIELTPSYGVQGTTIEIHGYNFTQIDEEEVTLWLDGTEVEDFETDDDGEFEGTFTIPAISTGDYDAVAVQDDYNIESEEEEFKIGLMIVILSPDEGPSGTEVAITGTGFTDGGTWNATFGDLTIIEDGDVDEDTDLVLDDEAPFFYVPTVDPGTYMITIMDVETEIDVEVEFEVTDKTTVELDPAVAPNEYNVTITGEYFAEDEGAAIEFVLFNSTDDWDITDDVYNMSSGDPYAQLDEDGLLEAYWVVYDDDELSLGDYTLNVTYSDNIYVQVPFSIVGKTEDIEARKDTFAIGDTVSFDIVGSFAQEDSYIKIWDPDDDLYWMTDPLTEWVKVGDTRVAPYYSQVSGGNQMILIPDAPLGTWTWTWYDSDGDELDDGTFTVVEAAEAMLSEQMEALSEEFADLSDEFADLSDDLSGDMADTMAAVGENADAIEDLSDTMTDISGKADDAKTSADNAKSAADAAKTSADEAKTVASGLTTLVYGAIGASLVAALAAIVSLMQISRRIAG